MDITGSQLPVTNLPVCPHCGQDPANVCCRGPFANGTMSFIIFFCGNPECRKIWNCAVLEITAQRVVKPTLAFPGILPPS